MKVDCQWFDDHHEAYFCETLDAADLQTAAEHLKSCPDCRSAVKALHDVDPLVKQVMEYRLAEARRAASASPRIVGRRLALAGSVVALAAALIAMVLLRPHHQPEVLAPELSATRPPPTDPVVDNLKKEDPAPSMRAKPVAPVASLPATPEANVVKPGLEHAIPDNAPAFLVIDPEGYSKSLQDYRDRVLLVGVWSAEQPESIQNLQKLYQAFGTRRDVRILGVASHSQNRPAGTTFPMVFNNGSRLLETHTAGFVIVDKDGSVQMRGSLNGDAHALLPKVKVRLDELAGK